VTYPKPVTDWTPEAGYPPDYTTEKLPWKPRGAGTHLGLTLVLDANLDDYYCSSTASTGFKVSHTYKKQTEFLSEMSDPLIFYHIST
jgi:amiloride-sensitive sodium channel